MDKTVHQEVQNISSSPSIGKITGLKTEWSALLKTLTQTLSKHSLLH